MRARIGQDKIYARRDEGGESAKVGLLYRKFEPDAFDGARVPGELVAAEFLDELARLGRGRRMVICNVTDSSPFGWTRRFAAGLAERWRHLLVGTERREIGRASCRERV